MAQQGIQLDQETFSCSICLDLLKDPVTIPCGHSYCMSCIKTHWDEEDQKKICSCPQCRQTFILRPLLVKNTMLADLMEKLKKTELQAAAADLCYAGPADVGCDVCKGRKLKAIKSCLVCLASYCQQHLQPHYDSPTFKKHKLTDPSKKLQENICSCHGEVMKIFCHTDQQVICYLCSLDEHKGHNTISAAAEVTERQKKLQVSRLHILQRIQHREEDLKVLQQQVEAINRSADKAVRDNEEIFKELIHQMEKQETEVSRAEELQEKMQQEISDLRRKDTELRQLSLTDDHVQFLHNYPSMSHLRGSTDSRSSIKIRPLRYFEDVTSSVSELRDKLQNILSEEPTKITQRPAAVDVLLPQSEPKTRDPNTANTYVSLSEGNRKATCMMQQQSYSHHPDRFINKWQVLSRESLTGHCYWEVEWSRTELMIAVTYKDLRRTGDESLFGFNDKSWALYFYRSIYQFIHNSIRTDVSGLCSPRLGVYLDHSAGILSFYSVSENMTLLHRVQTTFTRPLYAGLRLYRGVTAEFM
ncbi:hypothetical protein LDENG_00264400 [Lucifuga dentata]|nr:hypothetical protein LDENG_00264400 [Lucifuga dentata]